MRTQKPKLLCLTGSHFKTLSKELSLTPIETSSVGRHLYISSGFSSRALGSLKMRASLLSLTGKVSRICKRNFGICVPALQKASDPIQQLFLDKIREYKSKAAGGKMVEPSPQMLKELENDRQRVYKQFRSKPGEDLSKFPSISFGDPKINMPL